MSNYVIRRATPEDNDQLCALCNIPLQGNIVLALERAPDFFAGSKIQSEEIETYTCRKKDSNVISGVFSVGKRRVFLQNQIKQVRYFSDLRIHPAAQGSRVVYEISRFITDNNIVAGEVAQTIVFADNKPMLKLIERLSQHSKKMSIFRYFPAGNYNCYMVKFSRFRKVKKSYQIIKAESKHITLMQQLLMNQGSQKEFYPYYDFDLCGNPFYSGQSINNYYVAFENAEITVQLIST